LSLLHLIQFLYGHFISYFIIDAITFFVFDWLDLAYYDVILDIIDKNNIIQILIDYTCNWETLT
jgi:hypothetical protein